MFTKKGAKVVKIVGVILLSILTIGVTAAVIYQMTGGSLATVGETIAGWFTLPVA